MLTVNDSNRRPLRVRNANFAKIIAAWLCNKNISPNQISIASVFFAGLAALCLFLYGVTTWNWKSSLPIFAALFIQCRLLCNLFDGMVAVEGGKHTPSGELFNDLPDRIADPVILIAAGYATGLELGAILGWAAGLIAVLTAYVRFLIASTGAPMDFRGPMAKQHRMALMTFVCILSGLNIPYLPPASMLLISLLLIIIGGIGTLYFRVRSAYNYLEKAK